MQALVKLKTCYFWGEEVVGREVEECWNMGVSALLKQVPYSHPPHFNHHSNRPNWVDRGQLIGGEKMQSQQWRQKKEGEGEKNQKKKPWGQKNKTMLNFTQMLTAREWTNTAAEGRGQATCHSSPSAALCQSNSMWVWEERAFARAQECVHGKCVCVYNACLSLSGGPYRPYCISSY